MSYGNSLQTPTLALHCIAVQCSELHAPIHISTPGTVVTVLKHARANENKKAYSIATRVREKLTEKEKINDK